MSQDTSFNEGIQTTVARGQMLLITRHDYVITASFNDATPSMKNTTQMVLSNINGSVRINWITEKTGNDYSEEKGNQKTMK